MNIKGKNKLLCLVAQWCPTLCNPRDCSPPGSSGHGDSPSKNTGVGCHVLLQGIFLTQVSNLGLPHCRWILNCLNHQGSPRILEWVPYPFSRGSSRPRNWTRVSCIAVGFFTSWATKTLKNVSSCKRIKQEFDSTVDNQIKLESIHSEIRILQIKVIFLKPRFFEKLNQLHTTWPDMINLAKERLWGIYVERNY